MGKGSNKTTTTTNQSQAYTPNPYVAAAGQQALGGAQEAANAPFQMPVAPTAQFSPFQNQAFNQIQGMQGMSLPYFQQGANMLQGSAAPITGQDVGQYYNPFAQNVTNQMQNIFGQQNRMATSNAVRAAGGVGADRIGVAQANLANQQGLAAGQTYAGMYNQALQAAQQQKQMMAGAGFGMGQLGGAAQTSYLQGTGALAQAGAQQQALDQAQQNAIYQNRLAQIAYPFQTNQYLAGITGGLAPAMGGTSTGQGTSVTEKPQPSPLNQILGIGGSLLGAVVGGPAGAMIGSSLGSGIGSVFGGNAAAGFGGAGAGGAEGGYMSGGQMMPGPGYYSPWGYRRGGRTFASGGAAYGRLAEQKFADSPVGNPYANSISDDSESEDKGYAEGGAAEEEEPTPMPGTKPPSATATSIVPKIPLRMGAGHSGLLPPSVSPLSLDLRHAPDEKPQNVGGGGLEKVAGGLGKALSGKFGGGSGSDVYTPDDGPVNILEEARGGAVNPYDAGQGFQEGGSTNEELLQGIDAPMGRTEEPRHTQPSAYGPVFPVTPKDYKSPFERYTEANPTSEADVPPVRPSSPFEGAAQEPSPPRVASRLGREGIAGAAPDGQVASPEGPANPFAPGEEIPLPRGNPRTVGGVKTAIANEWSMAGMPPIGIGGVNMAVKDESNFNYRSREPDQPRFTGEAHYAHGLYQEGGDEWNNYVAWLKKNRPDYNWDDPTLQSRFTAQNLKENYPEVFAAMQRAKTPGEAADIFTRGYLKPASQHLAARSRRYLGGEGSEGGDGSEVNMSGQRRSPNIVGNRDLTIDRLRMPREKMPYPGASERNWGTQLARSPWGALIVGGARMAQTPGPVGSALGAGIEAGMGHLEGQRRSLATEEGINQRAEGLYQAAQKHLDQYQRMTPYQEYMKDYHKETLERTKYQPHNIEYTDEKTGEVVTRAVRFNPKTGVYEDPKTGEEISGKLIAKQTGAESATSRANRASREAKDDPDYWSDQLGTINKWRERKGLPPETDNYLGATKETAIVKLPPEKDRIKGKWYIVNGVPREWGGP